MCILEKETYMWLSEYSKLPPYLRQSQIVPHKAEKIRVKKILTIKKLNPTVFVREIYTILEHLQIDISEENVAQLISLHMARENICGEGLRAMNLERITYYKIMTVISERLPQYNNYLVRKTLSRLLCNFEKPLRELTRSLLEEIKQSSGYVFIKYIDYLNDFIEQKTKSNRERGFESRFKVNKVKLFSLSGSDKYISGHKVTHVGAVNWHMKTDEGKVKAKLLDTLMQTTVIIMDHVHNFEGDDVTTYEHAIEKFYKKTQASWDKRIKESNRLDRFHDNAMKYLREGKVMKTEKTIQLLKDKYSVKKKSELIKNALFRRSYEKVKMFWDFYHKGGDIETYNPTDRDIISLLMKADLKETYYLHSLVDEYYWLRRGNQFQKAMAGEMMMNRRSYSQINYYPGFIDLPFSTWDSILVRTKGHHSMIPDESEHKNHFKIESNYPKRSEYLERQIILEIQSGNYVDVQQLFYNGRISAGSFISLYLFQRYSRKSLKAAGLKVVDKHRVLNEVRQLIRKDASRYHNYNTVRKFNSVMERVLNTFRYQGFFISCRDEIFEGRLKKERSEHQYQSRATNFQLAKSAEKNRKTKIKFAISYLRRTSEPLMSGLQALSSLEKTQVNEVQFAVLTSIIYDSLLSVSRTTDVPDDFDQGVNKNMAYQFIYNPILNMFVVKLFRLMIPFKKAYYATQTDAKPEWRKFTKNVRNIELLLTIRFRKLWDLLETGKVYVHEQSGYESWLRVTRDIANLTEQKGPILDNQNPTPEDYARWLKIVKERRIFAYETLTREKFFEINLMLNRDNMYKNEVAKIFNLEKYIFLEEDSFKLRKRWKENNPNVNLTTRSAKSLKATRLKLSYKYA